MIYLGTGANGEDQFVYYGTTAGVARTTVANGECITRMHNSQQLGTVNYQMRMLPQLPGRQLGLLTEKVGTIRIPYNPFLK